MSKYEPLRIALLYERVLYKGKTFIKHSAFFQVRSSLVGNCPHKHRTPKAAQRCLELGKKFMREGRIKMKCPHCHEDMGWNSHGVCEKCKKYCGCSFNPTSGSDWCRHHDPRVRKVEKKLDGK